MKLDVPPPKLVLSRSEEQLEYEISSHDWDHLKELVDDICPTEQIHLTLGTSFLSISITALLAGVSLPDNIIIREYPGKLIFYAVFLAFLLGCIPCFIYANRQRTDITTSKDSTMRYLNHLEKKFGIESNLENDAGSNEN